uniref:DUF5641 domain-containing protein n=1 Tax=Brugia malayi TaxID=6279 RepID=A8PIT2_BRUMA
MTWKNIIPKAPWQGGIYERLIGLTKNALRRAIGRKFLAERELVTLIADVESILNTRPLTYANFDDCVIIRPIDFILLNASLHLPINEVYSRQEEFTPYRLDTREKLVRHWESTLKTLNVFWEIWRTEYLTSLRERTQREITSSKGAQKRTPRKGEIVETPTGKLLDRPINVLYPLEVNDEEIHLEPNKKENMKIPETKQNTEELQEPIAMRTRSNTKRQSRLKEDQTTITAPSSETCRDLHDQKQINRSKQPPLSYKPHALPTFSDRECRERRNI